MGRFVAPPSAMLALPLLRILTFSKRLSFKRMKNVCVIRTLLPWSWTSNCRGGLTALTFLRWSEDEISSQSASLREGTQQHLVYLFTSRLRATVVPTLGQP